MTLNQIAAAAPHMLESQLARKIIREAGHRMTIREARRRIHEAKIRVARFNALRAMPAPPLPSEREVFVHLLNSGEYQFIPRDEVSKWGKIEVIIG